MTRSRGVISVIVAAQEGEANPAACLASLLGQEGVGRDSLELILVDGRVHDGAPTATIDPRIRVLEMSGSPSLPRMQALGIGACQGDLIALTESHATFPPDWARTVQAVFEETQAVAIGGSVRAGQLRGALDWALYLVDYAAFVLPFEARETEDLPGCNVVFERRILPGPTELVTTGFWKTFHCRQLAKAGEKLWLDPRMTMEYNRRKTAPEWIRRRWVHGRCFGGMRARGLTPTRRLAIAVLAPVLPVVLMVRMWRRLWVNEGIRSQLVATVVSALLAHTLWVAGEWVGNLAGSGDACLEV